MKKIYLKDIIKLLKKNEKIYVEDIFDYEKLKNDMHKIEHINNNLDYIFSQLKKKGYTEFQLGFFLATIVIFESEDEETMQIVREFLNSPYVKNSILYNKIGDIIRFPN